MHLYIHGNNPTSLPNTPSESYDAGVTSVSNPPPLHRSIYPRPSSNWQCHTSRPTYSWTREYQECVLRECRLATTCEFPPFWNLFKDLDNLKGQRGAGVPQTDGGVTPLVDATVRFFKEFIVEEESPSTQQQSSQPQPEHRGPMKRRTITLSIRSNQRTCMMR
ncbi:hypothetical protein BGY98DRAFT_612143 [Russula aff. rugulosa BPL654]|nr:hypothetical protein BGY98DRAFT_612143 [Russula aff. rugulosa BPL654]